MDKRPRKGRGAISDIDGRYESLRHETADDGWGILDEELPPLKTTIGIDTARTIICRNDSPDVPFAQSINPYRGCEHGCIYCYARPSHAYFGLSPGLDFETRLFYKPDAATLLTKELRHPGYRCHVIALGSNTDPYQPIERRLKITRRILEVLAEYQHPVSIVTKSVLVERDLELLALMAAHRLVRVYLSITTLDLALAQQLEPRASAPWRRLETIARLAEAGIPTGVLTAPMIPALNDHELEAILEAAADAGARSAGYVLLRLPLEVNALFQEWLATHMPDRAKRIMNRLRETRGGRDNDLAFGSRMTGAGPYARLLAQRFQIACKRLGLNRDESELETGLFRVPARAGDQLDLFGGS